MIDVYLNQMMNRMDFTLDYALDKAFSVQAFPQDAEGEIFQLKKAVIKEAQDLYRPLAKAVLVESFTPKLHKRGDDGIDTANVLEETVPRQTQMGKIQSEENYFSYKDEFVEPSKIPKPSFWSFWKSSSEIPSVRSIDSDFEDPNGKITFHSSLNDGEFAHKVSDFNRNLMAPKSQNIRPETSSKYFQEYLKEKVSALDEHFPAEKSWNMQLLERVRSFSFRMYTRLRGAWNTVIMKLTSEKLSEYSGSNSHISDIFQAETLKKAGLVICLVEIGYLTYAYFFKNTDSIGHDYFD